jgi:hypothetical protein
MVRGFDVDFVEMREILREQLHERKADRGVAGQSYPQAPVAGCVCKRVVVRCVVQDGFRRMSSEQLGGRKLDRRKHAKMLEPSSSDSVDRWYHVRPCVNS